MLLLSRAESVYFNAELAEETFASAADAVGEPSGMQPNAGTPDHDFRKAVAELDAFIRSSFSVEEIHDAEMSTGGGFVEISIPGEPRASHKPR